MEMKSKAKAENLLGEVGATIQAQPVNAKWSESAQVGLTAASSREREMTGFKWCLFFKWIWKFKTDNTIQHFLQQQAWEALVDVNQVNLYLAW